MRVFYSYRRYYLTDGCGAQWVDHKPERPVLKEMVRLGLRSGDTLVLATLRDLGGEPAEWTGFLKTMGVRKINVELLPLQK